MHLRNALRQRRDFLAQGGGLVASALPARAQRVARWQKYKRPLVAVAAVLLLAAWESGGGPVAISAKYAEQLASGQLARDIAHSGGRFLRDMVVSLITRAH